jgi:hypothetical protein
MFALDARLRGRQACYGKEKSRGKHVHQPILQAEVEAHNEHERRMLNRLEHFVKRET